MGKNLFLFWYACLFLFLFIIKINAQQKQWENYISGGKKFTAIAEENNYLWVGTEIGLLKLNKTTDEITFYDKTTGLPCNYITSIAIDKYGNKWIGLAGENGTGGYGLAKFDGNNWEFFTTSNSPLPSNYISALYADKNENLWIGCSNLISYANVIKYHDNDWTIFDSNNSTLPSNGEIKAFAEDSTSIWIAIHGGLVRFDGANWELFNGSHSDIPSSIVNDVAVDNENNKWIGMFGGLAKFDDTSWTIFNENTPLEGREINKITIDKNGIIWLGIFGGLVKFDQTNFIVYDAQNSGLPADSQVDIVMTDSDNNKWIGCFVYQDNGRLVKFDEQNWKIYKTWKGELTSNYINFIKQDKEGSVWIGSDNSLIKILGNEWKTFTWQDTLTFGETCRFNSFVEDNNQNLWFSILGVWPEGDPPISGLLKFDGVNWAEYRPNNSGLPVCAINEIDFSENDNAIWLATSEGPIKFDGDQWTVYDTIINIIPKKYVGCLAIDGNIKWFGSNYGLIKLDGISWEVFNTNNSGISDNSIENISLDSQRNLWISTLNGLVKYDYNNWTVYSTLNSGLPDDFVTCVQFDKNNFAWITTYGGGVAKFDGSTWSTFNSDDLPILNNYLLNLCIDNNNNKWFNCSRSGISVYNESGILGVRSKKGNSVDKFYLEQNYPNPFNPETNIEYYLPAASEVTFKVYDILGKEILNLYEGYKISGYHTIKFIASGLASGVYFYVVKTNNYFQSRKMIYIK